MPTPSGLAFARVPEGLDRIYLRLPRWLGDVALVAPAIAALHRRLPRAALLAQAPAPFLELAGLLPGVREVFPIPRERTPWDLVREAAALRRRRFEAAIVFPRAFRAGLAASLARVPIRVGFSAPGKGALFTHPVSGWRPLRAQHRTGYFAALVEPFGATLPEPLDVSIALPPAWLGEADRLLLALGRRPGRGLVLLEAGARYGPAKCWPPERFGALARSLLATGRFDVITIGSAESARREAVVAAVAGPGLLRAVGRTPRLSLLLGLLSRADLLVTNDTGPLHLAALLKTPVLALFGASDPSVSGPWGPGRRSVLYDPEPCSPCFLRQCPIPGHPCLEKIAEGHVREKVLAMVSAFH